MNRLIAAALALAAAGCAQEAKKANLSGTVTFDGRPVPVGYVIFMPDSSAGNLGPVKSFPVKDGVYDTSKGDDPGVPPGAVVVTITGFNGRPEKGFAQGKQIFNAHELRDVVAEGAATKDFAVPPEAGKNVQIQPTEDT